jgi:hypothetical protein
MSSHVIVPCKKNITGRNDKQYLSNLAALSKPKYFQFALSVLQNTEHPEPVFENFLKSPGIDSQPGGIDSWAP